MTTKRTRLSLAVSAAIGMSQGAALYSAGAQAQEPQGGIVEEVVVTGSRLSNPALDSVSPTLVVSAEEFQLSGIINVEQKLAELPSTLPSFGPSSNNPGDGTARVDLRGLGTSRTLVLVNGRRWIPSTQSGVVDLNTIPGTLIESVDVVTGGASAVYGSDAVAGVVNFKMKDDFEGVEFTSTYDITEEGDAEKYNFDMTIGGNFADGRGNIVAYGQYANREALFQGERDFSSVALVDSVDDAGNPATVPGGSSGIPGTRIFESPVVPGAGFNLGRFGPNGEALPFVDPDDRFNYAPDNFLQLPQERYLGMAFASYEINEHVESYGEFAYSYNKVPQELAPTPAFTTVTVNPNSAFFAPETQAALGSIAGDDGLTSAFIGRRMVENGSRQAVDIRDAFRVLFGFRGDINESWSYDAYYSFSNLDNNQALNNDVSASRFRQALLTNDAGTACQDPSGGCVPLNIWGAGNISQEAVDFVNIGATNFTSIEQEVINVAISGELFTVPGAGYPVGIAFGYEERTDKSSFRPDTFLASGDVLGFNAGEPTVGGFDVQEVFAEVSVPLLSGKPFAEELSLWGAARLSDYSNIDDTVESFATALNWSPLSTLSLRVGFQQAVRAPNVAELFQGSANGFPGATDPCATGGFQPGTTDVDLCVATGVAPDQVGVFQQANSQIEGRFGGNPDLEEETSNTFTLGAVWSPIDSVDITLDYYDIEIEDSINVLGGGLNNTLSLCYNVVQDINSEFCQAISRRAGDNNIDVVEVLNANVGKLETSGWDLNVYYTQDFGFGIGGNGSTLDVNFNSTFLDTFDITPVQELADQVNECAGYFGNTCGSPLIERQFFTRATWRSGNWTLSTLLRYLGETDDDQMRPENGGAQASDLAVSKIDEEFYLDLTVSYRFEAGLNLSVGATNLFDTEPTELGDSQEQANTFPSTYPLFGPRYFMSLAYRF